MIKPTKRKVKKVAKKIQNSKLTKKSKIKSRSKKNPRKVCNPDQRGRSGTKYTKAKTLEVFEHDFYPKIKKEYGNRLFGDMFIKELNDSFNFLLEDLESQGLITEKQAFSWQNPYKYSS